MGKTVDKWGKSVEECGINGEKFRRIVEKPERGGLSQNPVEKRPESVDNLSSNQLAGRSSRPRGANMWRLSTIIPRHMALNHLFLYKSIISGATE